MRESEEQTELTGGRAVRKLLIEGLEADGFVRAKGVSLDAHKAVLESVAMSIRATPQWTANIMELRSRINRQEIDAIMRRGEITRQANQEAFDRHQESIRTAQESQDRVNHQFMNYLRDVDDYRMPDGSTVQLPSNYSHIYTNGQGQVILTNDASFDPSSTPGNWSQVQRARP